MSPDDLKALRKELSCTAKELAQALDLTTVTILTFWYVTVRNLVAYDGRPGALRKLADVAARNHGVVVTAWLLTIAALVFERFWAPWDSVFA